MEDGGGGGTNMTINIPGWKVERGRADDNNNKNDDNDDDDDKDDDNDDDNNTRIKGYRSCHVK
jgi:hypothetical protein